MTTSIIQWYGTGRRKEAVARVFLRPGSGKITVNGRDFEEYFPRLWHRLRAREALVVTNLAERFDALITTRGGGLTGQADAIRLGIARALLAYNPELRPVLKKNGLLTRDPRRHERKKYGQPGRRKKYQYHKR
jgi:small subunit ribosomal protein S9